MHLRLTAATALILLSLLLSGCATQPAAPVTDQSIRANAVEPGVRVVVAGDTLYSIAWESGNDYTDLAAWNHIPPPYRLIPGQKLRLTPPLSNSRQALAAKAKTREKKLARSKPTARLPEAKAKVSTTPKARARVTAAPKKKSKRTTRTTKRQTSPNFGPWAWPTKGKVLQYRPPSGAGKGLDIAGTRGQPIRAAARGRVVYVGSGLRGYGLLVIVKHDDTYLSAYAHNEKVYVKEGDVVKSGQRIADMGSGGADRVKLHFEIRRRGVPVNPLLYLPKK